MSPPTSPDAFDTLGLEPRFDLSPAAIQKAYLARSADTHPDRAGFSGHDPADASAELNAARRTLADPEARASALLARLGGPSKEADRSLPEGFLMEIMDVRQQVDEAVAAKDAAKVDEWIAWAHARRQEHMARVAELFAGDDPARLQLIRRELNAWRYLERMIEQVEGHDELEPA